jgi:hypothetical protein
VLSIDVNIPLPSSPPSLCEMEIISLGTALLWWKCPFYMTLNTCLCSTKYVCTSSRRRHFVWSCIQARHTLLKPTFLPHRILQLPLVFFLTDVFYLEIRKWSKSGFPQLLNVHMLVVLVVVSRSL